MTTVNFTSTQSWTVPSNCYSLTSCDATGGGVAGYAGGNSSAGHTIGDGGSGGGAGGRAIAYSIPVTPGEVLTVYVGTAAAAGGAAGNSGLYRSSTHTWLCLANGGSGINGGAGSVGGYKATGGSGVAGIDGNASYNAGLGGNGGASAYGANGIGGHTDSYFANGTAGTAATGYGSGGGGGGGGEYVTGAGYGTGGAGGAGHAGFTQIVYTPYTAKPPTVTNVSPTSGSPGGGTSVTITGTNFDNEVSAIMFGTVPAASSVVHSATEILAVSPPHAAGVYDIFVTNKDGTNSSSSSDYFTFKTSTGFNNPMGGL